MTQQKETAREPRNTRLRIHFDYGSGAENCHDWSSGDGVTVHGPKFKRVKLGVHPPSTGYRFIFYFPSGAWWHFDVYFDRRGR